MPSALLTRIDLDKLYPPFAYKVIELVGRCHDQGVDYYATSGFRTPEEQLLLWRKGRSVDGKIIDPKAVVTTKKFGAHNVSVACDLTFDKDLNKTGLQPSWNRPDYELLAREAVKLKLESGHYWTGLPDSPHVQLPLNSKGILLSKLRLLEQVGGLEAVWKHLDKYSWD